MSHVGYIRICNADADEQTWNKKSFVEEYNDLKDREITNLQIGNSEDLLKIIERSKNLLEVKEKN